MQCDEKWAFVGKKEANCNPHKPDDERQGDQGDHVALDAEHRLVLSVAPGKRTAENVQALLQDVKKRLDGRTPNLITTDEYPAYKTAVLRAFGEEVVPEPTGKPGRPRDPYFEPKPEWNYAVVHKTRKKGRVTKIDYRVIFGTMVSVTAALALSRASKAINTAFIERQRSEP